MFLYSVTAMIFMVLFFLGVWRDKELQDMMKEDTSATIFAFVVFVFLWPIALGLLIYQIVFGELPPI